MSDEPSPDPSTDPLAHRTAIDDAFTFVLPSIERALQRVDAIDARLQHITTAIATLTFAGPVAAQAINEDLPFNPADHCAAWLLLTAMLLGILGLGYGHIAKTRVPTRMLRITDMYKNHRDDTSSEFRAHIVRKAGQAEDTNLRRLKARALSIVLSVEGVLLVLWVALSS